MKILKFYGKFLPRASNHVENWPCLAFYVNGNEFGHLGQNLVFFGQNWPFLTLYDKNFKNSYSGPQARWKSGLVLLSRPLFMCFVIRLKFGPFRPKISQLCGGTPTFYWCPRLYLPIGIQNWPYFCWCIYFHFCLGSKSQGRPVKAKTKSFSWNIYSLEDEIYQNFLKLRDLFVDHSCTKLIQ